MLHTIDDKDNLFFWLCRIGSQFQSAFLITDPTNREVLYANEIFTKLTGYSIDEIKNEHFDIGTIFDENVFEVEDLPFQKSRSEELCRKKDGCYFWIDLYCQPIFDSKQHHVFNIIIFSDITNQKCANLAKEQEKVQQLIYTDAISGLKNYNYFIDTFQEKIDDDLSGFILLIQPSDYIQIVDTFGKTQLAILQSEIEQRIKNELADIETIVSRATEASLIVYGKCTEEEIEYYLQKLLDISKDSFQLNGIDLYISFSIGAVSLKNYNGNIDDLVRFADIALSQAKKKPGNSVVTYKEEFAIEISKKMEIQNKLIHAIQNKEITVYLQPKIKIETGEVVGFEALARWYSDTLGHVSPVIFIEAAETLGKIHEVDTLVLEQVLSWLKNRKDRNLKLYQVAVIISPSHFYMPTFVDDIVNLVNKYEIEPKYIKLEITESVGLVDLEKA
ncbi:MAG: EAL domain-containing protein [Lysinibacillus sp.]|nr:EAL domain-containing protein [Lysinibacillus sp.]